MNLIFTIVAAFPLGFLVRRRRDAILAYLIIDSFLFSFQTLGVLLTWMSGAKGRGGASGFGDPPSGPFPIDYASGEVAAYAVVNLVIILAGIGLVLLGVRAKAWRAARGTVVDVG